jgi:hypothetical protein
MQIHENETWTEDHTKEFHREEPRATGVVIGCCSRVFLLTLSSQQPLSKLPLTHPDMFTTCTCLTLQLGVSNEDCLGALSSALSSLTGHEPSMDINGITKYKKWNQPLFLSWRSQAAAWWPASGADLSRRVATSVRLRTWNHDQPRPEWFCCPKHGQGHRVGWDIGALSPWLLHLGKRTEDWMAHLSFMLIVGYRSQWSARDINTFISDVTNSRCDEVAVVVALNWVATSDAAWAQQGVFLDEDGTIYPKLSRSHAGDLEAVQASAMSFQGNPSIWAWDRKKMDSKSKWWFELLAIQPLCGIEDMENHWSGKISGQTHLLDAKSLNDTLSIWVSVWMVNGSFWTSPSCS